ncbi:MAG: hypothetical protein HQL25_05470, partial [Candidatus Omnitrophica bacterium]|nr:hypothetical protein [Candidatus Omnitrophota bacterium]
EKDDKRVKMGQALLATMSHDPNLVKPMQQAYNEHLKELNNPDFKFEKAAVVSLAADGLFLLELLRLSPYSASQKNIIINELVKMIDNEVLK